MTDIVERLRDSDTTRRIGESYVDVHDRRQADRDEAADEITRLRAENERLKKMVKDAYNAGFLEGMKEHTSSRGGIPWADSKFRVAITQEKRDE